MSRWLLPLVLALAVTARADERALVKEVVIKATPEAAWKAWTTAEGVRSFFAPEAVVEARPMGLFEIRFDPYAPAGLRGADDMRFLALQEPSFLSFTWNSPPHLAQVRGHRTVVTVRFTPAGEGQTKVTLRHGAWGAGGQWDESFKYFDRAWGRVLDNLRRRFDEGPIDWAPYLEQLRKSAPAATAPGR